MKITIIGIGYVGLVSAVGLARIGNEVIAIDSNKEKISLLKNGVIPIYEPDLSDILISQQNLGNITFTTDFEYAINQSDVIFIAVGTPQNKDGSADLTDVFQLIESIAKLATDNKIIVTKSTVPAGTGAKISKILQKNNQKNHFHIVSNPEFLREGFAVNDFLYPERVVIGVEDEYSKSKMLEIYRFFDEKKIIFTNIVTAELIKYAANSFLATKICFINEMADLCEAFNGDIAKLSYALGLDSRIGNKFLDAGPGFGGSCFPKDINAICNFANDKNIELSIVKAVINSNNQRFKKIASRIAQIANLKSVSQNKKINIAFLGIAFKAQTDDIRCSPAIFIIDEIIANYPQFTIFANDIKANDNARKYYNQNQILIFDDVDKMIIEADLIVIATEWQQYRVLDWNRLLSCNTDRKTIFDLRNLLNKDISKSLPCNYYAIGHSSLED